MNEAEFKQEVERLGISVEDQQMELLEKFYQLLIETNKTMNLTRIVDKKEVYLKHFYDSLTIVKIFDLNKANKIFDLNKANTLLDIGSGAGFPGIVLKIFFPHLKITLIDALQKRINYLNKVIEALSLENISAEHLRAEELIRQQKTFDVVTARAVAALPKLLTWAMPLVSSQGAFIAMKGKIEEELVAAQDLMKKNQYVIERKITFLLPKEESKRTLLLITRTKS